MNVTVFILQLYFLIDKGVDGDEDKDLVEIDSNWEEVASATVVEVAYCLTLLKASFSIGKANISWAIRETPTLLTASLYNWIRNINLSYYFWCFSFLDDFKILFRFTFKKYY